MVVGQLEAQLETANPQKITGKSFLEGPVYKDGGRERGGQRVMELGKNASLRRGLYKSSHRLSLL